jgi:DASS family divalent anion:Na+ symporter
MLNRAAIKWNQTFLKLGLAVVVGFLLFLLPHSDDISPVAWRLFSIFVATILAIILKPFPMGVISLFALTVALLTQSITIEEACAGFGHDIVWLVVLAFFIAKGVIMTGLGSRIGYNAMSKLGKNSLGLGYGLVLTDLVLAPCIPSVTARAGGIVYPILKSLVEVFTGPAHDPRMGSFLALCAYQGSVVTSAMFLTAMSCNPWITVMAREQGISINWMSWAVAALVPGIITLFILPYFLYRFFPPSIRETPHARLMARERLRDMGPMSVKEKIMLGTFLFLIVFWMFGHYIGLKAAVGAFVGVSILLLTSILCWKDILEEESAWDTLIWFATLMTLAGQLNKTGLTTWFSQFVAHHVQGFHWATGFSLLSLVYFYSHYFFASTLAHISAMFAPFLLVAIALGTPPELAALVLGFSSSLYMGLTHYGSGAAPIIFGAGYVSVGNWWKAGALCSVLFIVVWAVFGSIWWKVLGLW